MLRIGLSSSEYVAGSSTAGHPTSTIVGASSNHPGGVNVTFLDGSVKFDYRSYGWKA